ncbi:molybdopterin cofactor-binding domain-containing protein [Actinopolymorpha sp. B17G11]|uniref:molybdopterin cofactor-binding domain-containing protein n=1 Tax=Actinopolymorpha sp. B17G11 TaxID=3160861 RepID=UPI0032E4BBB1
MSGPEPTAFVVNETPTVVDADRETPLVYVLRHDLALYGVRPGCAVGECGACVVLVDGRPERSCQLSLAAAEGTRITTPEGLGTPEEPHEIQQAFLDEQAAQCGYCLNGIIMSTAGLLAREPSPDEAAIQEALEGHLCRCGTHHRILRAVRKLAGQTLPPCAAVVRPDSTLLTDPRGLAAAGPADVDLPGALRGAPNVEDWLRPLPDGRIEARSGRSELGQGVRTALAQVVAAELDVPVDRIVVRQAATDATPDEGYTAGSASLEQGGTALAMAAAAFRRLRAEGCPPLGPIRPDDRPRWTSPSAEGASAGGAPAVGVPATGATAPGGAVGQPVHRIDLTAKLTGAPAYVHDLALPGLLHARALLPPTYDAALTSVDVHAAQTMPGVRAVVHDGRLVVVVADREEQAVAGVRRLARSARWEPAPLVDGSDASDDTRRAQPVRQSVVEEPGVTEALAAGRQVHASYAKPHEAHASIAPSAAVALAAVGPGAGVEPGAEVEPGAGAEPGPVPEPAALTVWTHSQGVYPLRRELAALLGVDADTLTVRHVDGPGCYGHNGADDAAGFAALAARAVPGRPVRFQFSVRDEFTWEPYGPAMQADLDASLDTSGRITGWRHHIRTGAHTSRPHGTGDRLMVAWLRAGGPARPWAGGGEGGVRSALPAYDIPAREIVGDYVKGPLRTSALRSLGAYFNTFAIESFMDELAEAAGKDPVEFRLAHLSDPRARAVLETAAERAGWQTRIGPSGRGQGVAVARYKGSKAYAALVVDAGVNTTTAAVTVRRVVAACDAGVIVNPDGLANQIEGGILQGLSRALHEEVRHGTDGIESVDWTSYPILPFSGVPTLDLVLLDRPGLPPLGAGEASTPVAPAALANAVDDAVGIRMRTLPITPDRLRARLEELTDDELARVLA